jgi:hypothetical protein
MSTLMMAGSIGEQEYLVKLAQLKAWMKSRHLTTQCVPYLAWSCFGVASSRGARTIR